MMRAGVAVARIVPKAGLAMSRFGTLRLARLKALNRSVRELEVFSIR